MDQAIIDFFEEKKSAWLKKNLKESASIDEEVEIKVECNQIFSLDNWIPNAAKRAGQMKISTHPCTFSHPSARKNKNGYVSSIISKAEKNNDGFVRSGNIQVAQDALGNAAVLDVYKFLMLTMSDGLSLIEHLEQDSPLALELLTLNGYSYHELKNGFMEMLSADVDVITSSKIKQVFFPVEEGYHQLSILTASGISFELRRRVDAIRFGGDALKLAREKRRNNEAHDGYQEIYNLTTIGYGGTQPQNISVLNSQNAGKAHLLMSLPPQLKSRNIQFPKIDFFSQTLNPFQCKEQFHSLHKLYQSDGNNIDIRNKRDAYYQSVIEHMIEKMWQVRSTYSSQYFAKDSLLSSSQKTWLCDQEESKALRETTDDWLEAIVKSATNFLFNGYEKVLGKKAIKFSDDEYKHMKKIVNDNKEAFR